MRIRVVGLTLIELLCVLTIVAIILCYSIQAWYIVPASVARAQCVAELTQALQHARLYALLRQHPLRLVPLERDNWAQGVRLMLGDTVLREWQWPPVGVQLLWHGFRARTHMLIDYDLTRLAMNGYFIVERAGERLAPIKVTRFGRVY